MHDYTFVDARCSNKTESKRRRLLFAETDDEVFMTRIMNVTPKTIEHDYTQWQI